ncbi:MAG: AMP-binding protein, partial [Desulfobacterales bacterium]|nr:AMP-binding protein [Desulfobacterales bacterium]
REMNHRINRAASYLQGMGCKKGDRISCLLLNCPQFLEVYFAAAKLGLILVPLNIRMVPDELEYQINDSGCRLLVFHDDFTRNVEAIRTRITVETNKFVFLPKDDSESSNCPSWANDYHEGVMNSSVEEPKPDQPVELDSPQIIMYTSGVTGNPKGAVLTHLQTYFKNFQMIIYTDMREGDISLCQLPLFHSAGLFMIATPALCRGATLIMRQNFDPIEYAKDIERYRVTILISMTSMMKRVLDMGILDHVDTSSLRFLLGGGEKTPLSLADEFEKKGLHMQQGLGQTENSIMLILPKKDITRKKGSIGLPGFFTKIWVEDKEGKKSPPGEIGEMVAVGPTVMSGYWNMPEKTAETIVNGVLRTGDLSYCDEEGYFFIVDRAKDMYRSGGENVYPAQIEKVLADHPKISNVAIIGVPDEKWGETGMAFIVPKEGEKVTEEEVFDFLKDRVSRFKFPRHVKFVDTLPMTASGKVKKVELKRAFGGSLEEK